MSTRRSAETFDVPLGAHVFYGKYKNKKGKIIAFKRDEKGNAIVVVEPIPKGRKHNKEIQLFRIWPVDRVTATEQGAWRAAGVSMNNVRKFARSVTGLTGAEEDAWVQAAGDWWDAAPRSQREKVITAVGFNLTSDAQKPKLITDSWDSLKPAFRSAVSTHLRKVGAIMVTPEELEEAPEASEGTTPSPEQEI